MDVSMFGRIPVRTRLLALAACALCAGATLAADAKADGGKSQSYKVVKRGGVELYCRTETVTGSRTQKKETCLTKEQVDAERARGVNIVTAK